MSARFPSRRECLAACPLRVRPRSVRPGDQANGVFYIQAGSVKLRSLSSAGKEAGAAMPARAISSGKAAWRDSPSAWDRQAEVVPTAGLRIQKRETTRTLHERPEFSDWVHRPYARRGTSGSKNSSSTTLQLQRKRLARTLLLLARYGKDDMAERPLPKLSQETLAEMLGRPALPSTSS